MTMILKCIQHRKSVVAEKFIRNLKNKIYKYITRVSENMYITKPAEINIQMKPEN